MLSMRWVCIPSPDSAFLISVFPPPLRALLIRLISYYCTKCFTEWRHPQHLHSGSHGLKESDLIRAAEVGRGPTGALAHYCPPVNCWCGPMLYCTDCATKEDHICLRCKRFICRLEMTRMGLCEGCIELLKEPIWKRRVIEENGTLSRCGGAGTPIPRGHG